MRAVWPQKPKEIREFDSQESNSFLFARSQNHHLSWIAPNWIPGFFAAEVVNTFEFANRRNSPRCCCRTISKIVPTSLTNVTKIRSDLFTRFKADVQTPTPIRHHHRTVQRLQRVRNSPSRCRSGPASGDCSKTATACVLVCFFNAAIPSSNLPCGSRRVAA